MRLKPEDIPVPDDATVEWYARMTPAERLAAAHEMWRQHHAKVEAEVRAEFPSFTERQIRREICARMLGSDVVASIPDSYWR